MLSISQESIRLGFLFASNHTVKCYAAVVAEYSLYADPMSAVISAHSIQQAARQRGMKPVRLTADID